MNIRKAIKKIVALGSGLTMIGATIMGATALDLGDYPAPFVQNGAFNGKIVVGANAATADVLGAIDISASLQADAKSGVDVGGVAATTTVSGGVLIEDSGSQDMNMADTLSTSTLDDQDLPVILVDGILEDDDGTEYDFAQEIVLSGESLAFGVPDNDIYMEPIVYLDTSAASSLITFTIDFDDAVAWAETSSNADDGLNDGESFELFGTAWTIKNIITSADVVLYGSDVTQLVSLNSPIDIEIDEEDYTLNLVGANSDASPAEVHVSVNGNVKSMHQGETKTINGLKVYVKDVFVSNVGGESASAVLFIGSKELNLGSSFGSAQSIEVDSEVLDGIEVYMYGSDTGITQIDFIVDPTSINNEEFDEDYDWLALGDTLIDPLFGFELNFAEAVPTLDASSNDMVKFKTSTDNLIIEFTSQEGTEYSFSPYQHNGTHMIAGDDWVLSGLTVTKGDNFILYEDAVSSEPASKVFEFTGTSDSDTKANFKDIGSGQTYTVSNTSTLAKTGAIVTTGDDIAVFTGVDGVNASIVTQSGMYISWPTAAVLNNETFDMTIIEDWKTQNRDEETPETITLTVSYDTGTDDEFNFATPSSTSIATQEDDAGDWEFSLTDYGSYFVLDAEDNNALTLYEPYTETDYRLYLSGPDGIVSTSGGSDGATYYSVNPIGVGIGVLDTDAPSLGSTPMIVIGGPCANTVAAELMGNPANCVEGFEEGRAVIRFYESDNAILVAGYSAKDTQGASRVLADYADWDLEGSEVEVVVPSLTSISVNPVA